jgi:hypothetical protein
MLRNRTEQEEILIKGVNIADDQEDLAIGTFTGLQNWVVGDLYSVKRKRGVTAFTSTVISPTTPTSCGV